MSDTKNNGGTAFPVVTDMETWIGMSKRDYFAAKAMQGLVANGYLNATWKERVKIAYEIADAMLKAREQ